MSSDQFIKAKPEAVVRLFRALKQAESFIKHDNDEALKIAAQQLKVDASILKDEWISSTYELSLNQSLLITMEDKARWMITNKLTDQTRLPYFLDYIDAGPLAKVDPKAVGIIIPKDERRGRPRTSRDGAGAPMRIRTRVKIGGALTICVLLAYGALVLHLDRTMGNLAQEIKEADEIVNKITTLRTLTQDFLLYRTERAQRQWAAVYAEILQLLHITGCS